MFVTAGFPAGQDPAYRAAPAFSVQLQLDATEELAGPGHLVAILRAGRPRIGLGGAQVQVDGGEVGAPKRSGRRCARRSVVARSSPCPPTSSSSTSPTPATGRR